MVDLFPTASFQEREVYDFFGVEFDGHPDPRRILMPEDYVGHPQRRDFPMGGEPVLFTFNEHKLPAGMTEDASDGIGIPADSVNGSARRRWRPVVGAVPTPAGGGSDGASAGERTQAALKVPYREREESVTSSEMAGLDPPIAGTELEPDDGAAHHQHRAAPPGHPRCAAAAVHAGGRDRARPRADHRLRAHRHREVLRGPGVLEGHHVRGADGLPGLLLQRVRLLLVGRGAARRGGSARARSTCG
ncbi:MAG: NADH-quinone oxidoreductase subunit C [Thermoleophilaceae bacterium]